MSSLLALMVLVLDIFAIVDLVKGNLGAEKKVLWILLILCLPILGLILYYLVGKTSK